MGLKMRQNLLRVYFLILIHASASPATATPPIPDVLTEVTANPGTGQLPSSVNQNTKPSAINQALDSENDGKDCREMIAKLCNNPPSGLTRPSDPNNPPPKSSSDVNKETSKSYPIDSYQNEKKSQIPTQKQPAALSENEKTSCLGELYDKLFGPNGCLYKDLCVTTGEPRKKKEKCKCRKNNKNKDEEVSTRTYEQEDYANCSKNTKKKGLLKKLYDKLFGPDGCIIKDLCVSTGEKPKKKRCCCQNKKKNNIDPPSNHPAAYSTSTYPNYPNYPNYHNRPYYGGNYPVYNAPPQRSNGGGFCCCIICYDDGDGQNSGSAATGQGCLPCGSDGCCTGCDDCNPCDLCCCDPSECFDEETSKRLCEHLVCLIALFCS